MTDFIRMVICHPSPEAEDLLLSLLLPVLLFVIPEGDLRLLAAIKNRVQKPGAPSIALLFHAMGGT